MVDGGGRRVGVCKVLEGLATSVFRNESRVWRATVVAVRSMWGGGAFSKPTSRVVHPPNTMIKRQDIILKT